MKTIWKGRQYENGWKPFKTIRKLYGNYMKTIWKGGNNMKMVGNLLKLYGNYLKTIWKGCGKDVERM